MGIINGLGSGAMNRRDFLKSSTFAAFASGMVSKDALAQGEPTPSSPSPAVSVTPPVLQNVSSDAVTVLWSVSTPATGWVEYGETEALGKSASGEVNGLIPFDARILRVRLTGLLPGRKYFYRVHTAAVDFKGPYNIVREKTSLPSQIHSFTTLDPTAAQASFSVWNDTHEKDAVLSKLVGLLDANPGDFHVWNGDVFNDVRSEESMIQQVLNPAGLAYATSRPLAFVRGNHDTRGLCARTLERVIDTPDRRYYYTLRHGPLALLVLDTGEDKEDNHREYGGLAGFAEYRSEQQRWLEHAIEQPEFKSATFKVLCTHIPIRGFNGCTDGAHKWQSLLQRANIDFAISGHTHKFAYNAPTDEQAFPLLIGGSPTLEGATFIHAHATCDKLTVRAMNLDGKELGKWEVGKKG